MSFRRAYFSFALPISLVLAVAACGQGNQGQPVQNQPATGMTAANPNQSMNQPMPNQSAPAMVPTGPASTAMTQNPACMNGQNAANCGPNSGGPGNFNVLAGSKGYISKDDASRGPWIKGHFAECDSNHDNKVTRTEYDACRATASSAPMSAGSSQ
ncbi:MAG: hypothetical protein ACREPY_10200 [Rhodanobacteraceae bacterium]